MRARGVVPDARGMAGKAMVYGWDFSNDFAEMAIAAADGMVLSNHSYGSLTGWYHNSHTTCGTGTVTLSYPKVQITNSVFTTR